MWLETNFADYKPGTVLRCIKREHHSFFEEGKLYTVDSFNCVDGSTFASALFEVVEEKKDMSFIDVKEGDVLECIDAATSYFKNGGHYQVTTSTNGHLMVIVEGGASLFLSGLSSRFKKVEPTPEYAPGQVYAWNGGECPVPKDTTVTVWFRDGDKRSGKPARFFEWRSLPKGVCVPIVAFEVVKPAPVVETVEEWFSLGAPVPAVVSYETIDGKPNMEKQPTIKWREL